MSFPYGAVIGNDGVNLTGAWSDATTYAIKDAAENGGTSYVALAPSTDIEPGVDEGWEDYWMIWAEKGDAGATGATGPAGPAGPDPTGAGAGEVWTADGDGDADWAAPSGGGGDAWTSIVNPGAATEIDGSGVVFAALALDGAQLVQGARIDWRARVRAVSNSAGKNITALQVQLRDAGDLLTHWARLGGNGVTTISNPAAEFTFAIEGSLYVFITDVPAFEPRASHILSAVGADFGRLVSETLTAGASSAAGTATSITRIVLTGTDSGGGGPAISLQALELAYKITPPTAA